MRPFFYVRASDAERAIRAAATTDATYIAGGTTVVDLMRLEVMRPHALVDISALPDIAIEPTRTGVRIGALARNSDVAANPIIAQKFPALAEALLSGASPQIRNMASVGGNLLQRTRCPYFRDLATPCNRREPKSGCSALDGYARSHALLGTSEMCIATHPSDMCVALAALDAIVHVRGPSGARTVPITELHPLPADHPEIESTLRPGELITHVELAATPLAARSHYVKVRDRASYAFALASAAVGIELANGAIKEVRIALGGVATKPWRAREAEATLLDKPMSRDAFERAAMIALADARPRPDNAFKVELAQRTIVRALSLAGGLQS